MKQSKILFLLASLALASCATDVTSSHSSDTVPNESTGTIETPDSTGASSDKTPDPGPSSSSDDKTDSQGTSSQGTGSIDELPVLENDPVWNVNGALNSLRGAAFRAALSTSIKATGSKTCSYKQLWTYLEVSDAAKDGRVRPFYHSPDDSAARGSCNKEHVWPSSRGAGETGPGSDPQVIRPAISSENSDRGNHYFGEGGGLEFDPGSLGYDGARGEAARIVFYAATRYYDTCGTGGSCKGSAPLVLNNNPGSDTILHSLGTLKTLLKWNRAYPVNEAEIKRNNELSKMGFARNPFIEHPEYADYIWNATGLRDSEGQSEPTGTPHELVPSLSSLNQGDKVFVVADIADGICMAMTKNFNANTPWYIRGVEVPAPKDGVIKTDAPDIAYFTVNKNSDGTYRFASDLGDLYSFIDGTHYSICYGKPASSTATPVSTDWTVEIGVNGALAMTGKTTNVALEYYNSSFCGYKRAGDIPLYLYRK